VGSSGSDRRPVIGLTAYATRAAYGVWDTDVTLLPRSYGDAVVAAGGVPVLLPALPGAVEDVLDVLDGLVVAGGPDVEPARYGAEPGPVTQPPSRERDAVELALVRAAAERRVPVLGICRGMQVLNVSRGGTLVQHLPDVVGSDLHLGAPGRFGVHDVEVAEGSLLAAVLSGGVTLEGSGPLRATVPSYHHQGVDTLGAGLVPVAWADDGVVEAVEDPSLPFCLGVQWHPEVSDDGSLFEGLVTAATSQQAVR